MSCICRTHGYGVVVSYLCPDISSDPLLLRSWKDCTGVVHPAQVGRSAVTSPVTGLWWRFLSYSAHSGSNLRELVCSLHKYARPAVSLTCAWAPAGVGGRTPGPLPTTS